MAFDPFEILFVSVRGMSVSQLLVVVGALLVRLDIWNVEANGLSKLVGRCMLPVFVFMELAKPESRDKMLQVFASSEGPLLVGLSTGLMIIYLVVGFIVVKLCGSSKGMTQAGNIINISVAFGNATALPVMLLGSVLHLFAKDDQVFLYLCVMVYGILNRALMYTAGSAICCGQLKPSLFLQEVNVASVLGFLVCFSGDITGVDLMAYLHSPRNWLDFAGTGKMLALMANPMLQMVSGASLSKGPLSEDLDFVSIAASCVVRLVVCPLICYLALVLTGITSSDSPSMKVLGFVLLMESGMPAASQLILIAIDSGVKGAKDSMATLLFWQSVFTPVTCTAVIAVAISLFSTAVPEGFPPSPGKLEL